MNKKILLIAFKFPPYAGVGGFRWSKLCKYLAGLGHKIHVVTVNWQHQGPNTLIEDVQHPNINIYRIPSGYPHNLKYRFFQNRYLNILKNLGFVLIDRYFFYDDEAQHWGRYLIPFCERLIKENNINVVVSTGGPFQNNRWASVLKKRNDHIRLIQDFRDPWTDDVLNTWIKPMISTVRDWQKVSVEVADCVVAATNGLLKLYLVGTQQKCGHVITNGHDIDFSFNPVNNVSQKDGYSFTYIGNLKAGREEPLLKFLEAVRKVQYQIPGIRVILVGQQGRKIAKNFADLLQNDVLELRGYVSQETAFDMVMRSTYALQFNAKAYPYLVSTKVYEYGMLKVPTVSFNYGGEICDLILNHDLGYSVNIEKEDIASFLMRLYNQPKRSFSFDINQFAYNNLAALYSELINNV